MKPVTTAKPKIRLGQSPMAIIGAILAFGLIRKLDKASTGDPTTSSSDENEAAIMVITVSQVLTAEFSAPERDVPV